MRTALYTDDGNGYPSNEGVALLRAVVNGYKQKKSKPEKFFLGVHQLDPADCFLSQSWFKVSLCYKYGGKKRVTDAQTRELSEIIDSIEDKRFRRATLETLRDDDGKITYASFSVSFSNKESEGTDEF